MTVWVDDARIPATVGRTKGRWSHLFADTRGELHEFAAAIGLRRDWFQAHERRWHYDVTESMRGRAIRAGAVPVSWREAPAIMRARDGLPPIGAELPAADLGSNTPASQGDRGAGRVEHASGPAAWVQASLFGELPGGEP